MEISVLVFWKQMVRLLWLIDNFDVTWDTNNNNYKNNVFKAGIRPEVSMTKSGKQTQSKPTVMQDPW